MTGEKLDEALADDAGSAENAGAEFTVERWCGTHASPRRLELWQPRGADAMESLSGGGREIPRLRSSASADSLRSPGRASAESRIGTPVVGAAEGPMRVPRNLGLKVLRTQTTISVSAANGRTLAWRTLAPDAASAWASS